jgi:hypothetical protein
MPRPKEKEISITITVSREVYKLLTTLCDRQGLYPTVADVVTGLVDHAQQGVYRPGAWEREWLVQAFGSDFEDNLELGDPYGRSGMDAIFQRPKTKQGSKQSTPA